MNKMYENIEYFHRKFESTKYHIDILGMKNTISEVKNSLYRINSRMDIEEDGISKSEEKSIQNSQTEAWKWRRQTTETNLKEKCERGPSV